MPKTPSDKPCQKTQLWGRYKTHGGSGSKIGFVTKIRYFKKMHMTHKLDVPLFGIPGRRGKLEVPVTVAEVSEASVIRWLASHIDPSGIFVDIGSHAGFYSISLAGCVESVWAFEPSIYQFNLLELNTRRNKLTNVELFPLALGSKAESRPLYVMGKSGGNNTLVKPDDSNPPMDVTTTDVITLDSLSPGKVSAIKIDVEGFEDDVLEGCQLTLVQSFPLLLIEHVTEDFNGSRLVSRLRGLGYELGRPFPCCPELLLAKMR